MAGQQFVFVAEPAQGGFVARQKPVNLGNIVGDDNDLWNEKFEVERVIWSGVEGCEDGKEVSVKIRHSHVGSAARIFNAGKDRVRIEWLEPQRAITPGQAAVMYDGDLVLGGGWIARR